MLCRLSILLGHLGSNQSPTHKVKVALSCHVEISIPFIISTRVQIHAAYGIISERLLRNPQPQPRIPSWRLFPTFASLSSLVRLLFYKAVPIEFPQRTCHRRASAMRFSWIHPNCISAAPNTRPGAYSL